MNKGVILLKQVGTKIYYLKNTGDILIETGDMQGFVNESTFDEDYENYIYLKKYDKDKIGCLKLEYGQLGQLLADNKANSYRVDVSGNPHKLVFAWIDYETGKPAEPPKTTEEQIKEESDNVRLEYATAIAELTEKVEKDKLELSTAIVEIMEMNSGGK